MRRWDDLLGWRRWIVALLLGLHLGVPRAVAHEGPEHEIEELTALIDAGRADAGTFVERALEYRLLARYSEAIRDLEHAIRLDPGSTHALRELARVQSLVGRPDDAVATLTRALHLPIPEPTDRAGLHVLRAELLRDRGEFRSALRDCEHALRWHQNDPGLYLLRSDLQRRLKLHRKRIAGLDDGIKKTGAGILAIERIEALLDAGRFRAALKAIEPELASARLRASWWVRRGRARLGLGDKAGGEEDLRAALVEIAVRLDPARPDPSLLLDQATALIGLGDRTAARQCHELARDKGGDPDTAERIRRMIDP